MTRHRLTHPDRYIDVPEAVGVFETFETLQAAVSDLLLAGFTRYDISVLAGHAALEEKVGKHWWTAAELEDDPDAPRSAFVSEDAIDAAEASLVGGFVYVGSAIAMATLLTPAATLLGSIAAVAVGAVPAGIVGTLLARRVKREHSRYYAEQIEHGGMIVWVRVSDHDRERRAVEIMQAHSGKDVHVHPWSEP